MKERANSVLGSHRFTLFIAFGVFRKCLNPYRYIINAFVLKVFFKCFFFFKFIFIFTLPPHRVRWERADLVEKTGNQEGK